MNTHNYAENLSRTVKIAIDSGEAATLEEAESIFRGYHLVIEVGPSVAKSPTLQAALLSAVNAGRRAFLGGVHVSGCAGHKLLIPWRHFTKVEEAVADLRGEIVVKAPVGYPRIIIGDVTGVEGTGDFAVRATFEGWCGGVIPLDDERRLPEKREFTPAGVLAGALAVSEAFQHVRGGNAMAGRRAMGMSLWCPEPGDSWLTRHDIEPELSHLPSKLWLVGLGHLGQAFLWTLGFLPYLNPEDVSLVLQDFDFLSGANDSTSPLTFSPVEKERKTRAMAKWCEERGFKTSVVERLFSGDFQVNVDEPMVAICGVDNAIARSALEDVGFERVIEAGLGKGEEYLAFQVHTFPCDDNARELWGMASHDNTSKSATEMLPAYKALAEDGLDECGLALLSGRTVGACFVGMVTSTVMVAELLRMIHGGSPYSFIDGSLRSLQHRTAITNSKWVPCNPGITAAAG